MSHRIQREYFGGPPTSADRQQLVRNSSIEW